MISYTTLILIVAIQLAVIGAIAFAVQKWYFNQPDKLIARYKMAKSGLIISWALLIAGIIGTVIAAFYGKHLYGFFTSFLILIIVFTFQLRASRKKLYLRNRNSA